MFRWAVIRTVLIGGFILNLVWAAVLVIAVFEAVRLLF